MFCVSNERIGIDVLLNALLNSVPIHNSCKTKHKTTTTKKLRKRNGKSFLEILVTTREMRKKVISMKLYNQSTMRKLNIPNEPHVANAES